METVYQRLSGPGAAAKGGGKGKGAGGGKGRPGGGGAVSPDLIRMQFNGLSGATVWLDTGSAGSVWTSSGGFTALSTLNSPPEGSAWVLIDSVANSLSTPYTAANALVSGSLFAGMWVRMSGLITSRYIASIQNASGTVAGTAWGWVLNAANVLHLIICDGTTRTVHNTGFTILVDTPYYIAWERVGNTIYPSVNGVIGTTLAFTGNINIPAAETLQLGAAQAGGGAGGGAFYDLVQIRRAAPFGGLPFTPPTIPIP